MGPLQALSVTASDSLAHVENCCSVVLLHKEDQNQRVHPCFMSCQVVFQSS